MFQPQVILHPTDFSGYSSHAFAIAADLARQYRARLLVLHVVETLGPENVTYGEVGSEREPSGYRQRLLDDLHRHVPAPADLAVEYLLAEGDPAAEIVKAAQNRGTELIVLGTHGLTGLKRLLTGSVAEAVVRRASCPVLITRVEAAAP